MILLDTHALLWLRMEDSRLGERARHVIDLAWRADELCISAASFWECAMLSAKRRITLPMALPIWRRELLNQGVVEIPIDGELAFESTPLRDFHNDPADRFIVATCLQGHRLVTADREILEWSGELDRIDASM